MEGTVGTREGLLRYGTGWRTWLVHGRGFCGTERDQGHGWYTGRASAVRNGIRGTGWYTGGASAVRNGIRGTVGTPQCVLVYEMYGKKDLYTR